MHSVFCSFNLPFFLHRNSLFPYICYFYLFALHVQVFSRKEGDALSSCERVHLIIEHTQYDCEKKEKNLPLFYLLFTFIY